jgi:hypothetical protein
LSVGAEGEKGNGERRTRRENELEQDALSRTERPVGGE